MMLNRNFKDFKFQHSRNKNQTIYTSKNVQNDQEVLNLIDNFLVEKNSFIFESVEKGKIRGRYTIFGKNPDKIWEFNDKNSYLTENNKKKKIKGNPEKIIEKIIEEFKFKTPTSLPPICSLISGYFSYDSIRYVEKIPNNCKNDLKLPDVRLLKPKTLVIHDNLKKKIFYIINVFKDEKINNYKKKYSDKNNVPRPSYWSGWNLNPNEVEFWLDGKNRIHQRLKYIKSQNGIWNKFLLSP